MSTSYRFDGPMLAAGYQFGDRGLGRLGADVPTSGDEGPGYLYPFLTWPADNTHEVWGEIVSFPLVGTLDADETSGFTYTAPYGTVDSFTVRVKRDGVVVGAYVIGLVIGASAIGGSGGAQAGGAGNLGVSPGSGLFGTGGGKAGGQGGLTPGLPASSVDGAGGGKAGGQGTLGVQAGLAGAGGAQPGGSAGMAGPGVQLDGTGGAAPGGHANLTPPFQLAFDPRFYRRMRQRRFTTRVDRKDPSERVTVSFDFSLDLFGGKTIVGQQLVSTALKRGAADPDIAQMLFDGPVVAGSLVMVGVQGGLHRNDYTVRCEVDASDGEHLVQAYILPVRNA